MKRIILSSLVCGAVICGLSGCSKGKEAGLQSAAVAGSTNSPESAATNPTEAIAAEAASAATNPVEIRIKWLAAKKYYFRMDNIQSWEVSSGPGRAQSPGKVTMGLTHDYAVSVVNVLADGGRELELEFIAQKMFYQLGIIPVLAFDSAQDPAQDAGNPVAPILRKLTGARVRCFTDVMGRVKKFEGFDELRARMAGGQPQVRAMLDAMFNEENLKQMCNFAVGLQPDDPVKIGDSWPVHLAMPDPVGLMVVDLNCTLKDWEQQGDRPCVRIEFQGDISSQTPPNGHPRPTTIDGGTISGKAWFDPALGMLANSATEQHMRLNTTTPGGTTVTDFNLTINFRLVRETDLAKGS